LPLQTCTSYLYDDCPKWGTSVCIFIEHISYVTVRKFIVHSNVLKQTTS
jgi:hypothetical protein